MKILTILGTRPEIIRLCLLIEKLDRASQHILVHTGQNYSPGLSSLFFEQLHLRQPDHFLGVESGTVGEQIGKILWGSEKIFLEEKPDRLLVLGDTNSGLSAVMAKRLGIPVYHMEAGNRCYDDRVPEEVNRRIIDHASDILMPYTERSRANLIREGIPGERIFVIGNPIYEVLHHFGPQIGQSNVLERLGLTAGEYFLVTMHRAENVDVESRLRGLTEAVNLLQQAYKMPVIISTHPHTKLRMCFYGIASRNDQVRFLEPFGLFDFVKLERHALCVLSDSGTVQEECCIFRVANVTLRDVTERPETLECGSNMLSGADPNVILRCVRTVLGHSKKWIVPREYLHGQVADTVCKILLGHSKQGR